MVPDRVVDIVINQFADLMEPGDILIDGGNELFTNSEARAEMVSGRNIVYMAMVFRPRGEYGCGLYRRTSSGDGDGGAL